MMKPCSMAAANAYVMIEVLSFSTDSAESIKAREKTSKMTWCVLSLSLDSSLVLISFARMEDEYECFLKVCSTVC